ncbi:DUF4402 domain-containing protein [uncultured Sunxiuqinia sp.]|uniref:DUF4402 domain-containing protein n=1 Tax=uncultured Sunxiuqinia sp. TaxID=1573825 RepID=UPI002AA6FBEA|nr:DUF4402 domain-containing protein [uncultured Sunxiuqinia sp.]
MYRYFSFILFLFLLLSGKVQAQKSVSAQIFAEVIQGVAATENQPLNFGRFITGTAGGSITISPDGQRLTRGEIIAEEGNYTSGQFLMEGDAGSTFSIKLPNEKAVLTHQESGKTMYVSEWISNLPLSNVAALNEGLCLIKIGATLNVGTVYENPVGVYTGSFEITFSYN